VRDKIPQIIASKGLKFSARELNDKEYFKELIKKLGEEVKEFEERPPLRSWQT
jgi:predicted house-cleaning noncanonical NTP pyrophosphatase (MazG superfamily)